LLILKKITANNNINTTNINLKYLEISEIRNMTNEQKKIGIKKLSKIKNFIKTDYILWIDYISTGNSFFNFLDLLPKNIIKKSYFFVYGDEYDVSRHYKNYKTINVVFHDISSNNFFSYFIAGTIGGSENYYIRCVNTKKIDKNYKLELFETNDIPLQKNIYGEHCINFSNFVYNLIETYYSDEFINL
jgi:hypothetical protein